MARRSLYEEQHITAAEVSFIQQLLRSGKGYPDFKG